MSWTKGDLDLQFTVQPRVGQLESGTLPYGDY